MYLQRFIVDFVPGRPPEKVRRCAQDSTAEGLPWGTERASIDMVKQFLMNRMPICCVKVLREHIHGPEVPCRVPAEAWPALKLHLCQPSAAHASLSDYPPMVNDEAERLE